MGNYSYLQYLSPPLNRVYLNRLKKNWKSLLEWLEHYKGITLEELCNTNTKGDNTKQESSESNDNEDNKETAYSKTNDDDDENSENSDEEISEEKLTEEKNNENTVSVADVMRALNDHRILGYMDGPMMSFFRNLVETIDWKDSERAANSKYYVVFSEEGWNNHHFFQFSPQGLREHIYQTQQMNDKQTKKFVKTHLRNANKLVWMNMENNSLREEITNDMFVQAGFNPEAMRREFLVQEIP